MQATLSIDDKTHIWHFEWNYCAPTASDVCFLEDVTGWFSVWNDQCHAMGDVGTQLIPISVWPQKARHFLSIFHFSPLRCIFIEFPKDKVAFIFYFECNSITFGIGVLLSFNSTDVSVAVGALSKWVYPTVGMGLLQNLCLAGRICLRVQGRTS